MGTQGRTNIPERQHGEGGTHKHSSRDKLGKGGRTNNPEGHHGEGGTHTHSRGKLMTREGRTNMGREGSTHILEGHTWGGRDAQTKYLIGLNFPFHLLTNSSVETTPSSQIFFNHVFVYF